MKIEKSVKSENFTEGSIPKYFAGLTAPLIAGNILQQFYNMIDALVIGWYAGEHEFAAVGVASSVMNLFLFAIVGACIGISVLLAQLYGAGDYEKFRQEHFMALAVGVIFSAAAALIGIFGSGRLLKILQTPDEIRGYARTYLGIVLAALPASFLYNFYNALLRAVGRVKASLGILACAMITNLLLDLFFVICLEKGIAGVAWATLIAQAEAAVLSIVYMKWRLPGLLFGKENCRIDRELMKKTVHYSGVTGLQQAGLYVGKLLVQGAVNTMGTDVISAYTATTRIEGFANSFGDSGCSSTSVLVGQNYGAKKAERVKKTVRVSFFFLAGLGIVSGVVMFFGARPIAGFMLGGKTGVTCAIAVKYLRIVAVFYIFCFTGNTFAGYFDGCGRVSVSMAGTVSQISIRTVLSWIYVRKYGLAAVAWATAAGWVYVNVFWAVKKRRCPTWNK